jgi:hypothetical protein
VSVFCQFTPFQFLRVWRKKKAGLITNPLRFKLYNGLNASGCLEESNKKEEKGKEKAGVSIILVKINLLVSALSCTIFNYVR